MDMDFMDLYRQSYAGSNMQSVHSQSHGQPKHAHFWNQAQMLGLYDHNHLKHHQVSMMGHPGVHGSKQAEPKPRLAKDEVDLLESEFAKNQKPNSNTKRELAEKMGVEVPRINNWFQNRRAKEKQVRKALEFEAQQAKDKTTTTEDGKLGGSAGSQDAADDEYDLDSDAPAVVISSAVFQKDAKDFGNGNDDEHDEMRALSELESTEYLKPEFAGTEIASPEESDTERFARMDFGLSSPTTHHDIDRPDPKTLGSTQTWCDFPDQGAFQFTRHESLHDLTDGFQVASPNLDALGHGGHFSVGSEMFDSFPLPEYLSVSHTPTFPPQMLADVTPTDMNMESHDVIEEPTCDVQSKVEHLSPASMSASPPTTTDLRFKCPPPPTDIAGRRKMRRPAPLGTSALRSASHCHGIKTGIDSPRRSDVPSPMRRIASATGVSGRIQKPLLSAGPRSPFTMERAREALLQSIQRQSNTLSPSPVPKTLTSAMSPLVSESMNFQGLRETTSDDDHGGYAFGSLGAAPLFRVEHAIKTPPGTPGLTLGFHESIFSNSIDHAWNFMPHDEPLPTPSLCSHGSELEFSMASQIPGYVTSHSQPVTPSFPPTGFGPTYNNSSSDSNLFAPAVDYTFPDSYMSELVVRSSPRQPKQFQFAQNVTPQNFTTDSR